MSLTCQGLLSSARAYEVIPQDLQGPGGWMRLGGAWTPPAQVQRPPSRLPVGGASVQTVQGVESPWLQVTEGLSLLCFF